MIAHTMKNDCRKVESLLKQGEIMSIEFETEEGCYEYNSEDGVHYLSIMGKNEVVMRCHFNFKEIEDTYTKMKEFQGVWPECFISGEWKPNKDIPELHQQLDAVATALSGWGLCMMGSTPPKGFGMAMAEISIFTCCTTPESFFLRSKELTIKL